MVQGEDRHDRRQASAQRTVEQIVLAAKHSNIRVLGVIAAHRGAGVTTLCRQIAGACAQAGRNTLLVDLTVLALEPGDQRPVWPPDLNPTDLIESHCDGYCVIEAPPTLESRARFNNFEQFRKILVEDLSIYEMVILDLPAVLEAQPGQVNPIAVARACDAVILICVTGRTTQDQIKQTMSALSMAGVQLGGTVLNDVDNPQSPV